MASTGSWARAEYVTVAIECLVEVAIFRKGERKAHVFVWKFGPLLICTLAKLQIRSPKVAIFLTNQNTEVKIWTIFGPGDLRPN